MGTSKGYISPSTPNWASAKRGISGYISDPSETKKKGAIADYSKAMTADTSLYQNAAAIFADFGNFVSYSNHHGIERALSEYGKDYINELSAEEAFFSLVNSFSEGNTIDDVIANGCISEALIVLEINSLDDFSKIDNKALIKELVCQFAKQKFAQMFDKHIKNKCKNINAAQSYLKDLQEYIYYTVKSQLTDNALSEINPKSIANVEIVTRVINKAFDLLEHYYDE